MKRKLTAALLALLLLTSPAAAVFAEEPEATVPTETTAPLPTEPDETTPEPVMLPTELTIETEHIYDGMDQSYSEGYIPTCENGSVHLVLPLQSSARLYGDLLKASLDLGGSSSPFVAANYEKTFQLQAVTPMGTTEALELYLVEFTVELSEDRTNGVYPITVSIAAFDANGTLINSAHTLYVTISDVPAEPQPPEPEPEKPTPEPVVYISDCVVTPETVMAGEEFALTLTLKNSLTTKSIRNMLVTVDTGNLQIELLEDSSVFQIERIAAGGETDLTLFFRSDVSIPAGKYTLHFSFAYDSSETLNLSSSGTAIVEIGQPTKLELVTSRFSQSVTVGETIPLSLQVLNMGRDTVHNVRCTVSGFGFAPSNMGYIGTMAAGSSATTQIELYIIALNTSPGNESGSPYGETTGTISLIYEDESGQEYHQETQFKTTVNRPLVSLPTELPPEEAEQQAAGQWWVSVLILGGVIIASIIGAVLIRRRNQISA